MRVGWTFIVLAAVTGIAVSTAGCRTAQPGTDAGTRSASRPATFAADSLPAAAPLALDATRAAALARLSLACVDKEYPNKPSDVLNGDPDVRPTRNVHPAFSGCFDWHSAVHGHWAMARLLKTFPDIAVAGEIRAALDRHLTADRIGPEVAYFDGENHGIFERPYGWGWLLRLEAELLAWDDPDARRWAAALRPLSDRLAASMAKYLGNLTVPIRDGTHQSTAFAMAHAHDYAVVAGDAALASAVERRARDFYLGDEGCPAAYEPSGEDFLSPCLAEADLMRRVLGPAEFTAWRDRFLPPVDGPGFVRLRDPVHARDRKDPRIGHLIGLSLHRAAAYRGVASALAPDDARRDVFARLSARHRDDGLAEMSDSGYGGEHWLASFAIYLLTDAGPYGVPDRP